MPRKALLRIEVVACGLAVDHRFAAVGVVGMAGYARVSIELRRCRSRKAIEHAVVKLQACLKRSRADAMKKSFTLTCVSVNKPKLEWY